MAAKITLKLQTREVTGRKVKTLRRQGLIPASLFGKEIKSQNVQVDLKSFQSVFSQAGETQIVYVAVGDDKTDRPVLIVNTQVDPVSDQLLHIDFRQVDLKEKLEANIPVELIGEAPAVKEANAVVVPSLSEIQVEALPADLPEKIEVDISILKAIGDHIKVADLKVDRSKVEIKTDPETIVVAATEQQKEEEPLPVAPTEGEAATEATPAAEGEQPAAPTEDKKE